MCQASSLGTRVSSKSFMMQMEHARRPEGSESAHAAFNAQPPPSIACSGPRHIAIRTERFDRVAETVRLQLHEKDYVLFHPDRVSSTLIASFSGKRLRILSRLGQTCSCVKIQIRTSVAKITTDLSSSRQSRRK